VSTNRTHSETALRRLRTRLGWGVLIVLAVLGTVYLLKKPWEWETTSFRVFTQDGSQIVISFECAPESRAEIVRETAEFIEIKAQVKFPANDCARGANLQTKEPVGDRTIIDHSTGEPVFDPFADTG